MMSGALLDFIHNRVSHCIAWCCLGVLRQHLPSGMIGHVNDAFKLGHEGGTGLHHQIVRLMLTVFLERNCGEFEKLSARHANQQQYCRVNSQ